MMYWRRNFGCFIFAFIFTFTALTALLRGAEAQKPERIRIGYSSISGSRIGLWAAHEKSFFTRHGLQSEIIVLPGIVGVQSLITGEVQFFLGTTDSGAQAASKGSDIIILATAEPIRYKLIVQPSIKTLADLKGKKIVIDRVGGTSYYISLRFLEKLGLKPDNVDLIQVGGGGNQRVAAFKSGVVSAVVSSSERFEQLKIPYHTLGDAIQTGIKIVGNSYMTTRAFRNRNHDGVQRTVRALVEARSWIQDPKNREATMTIFGRYLQTDDPRVLDLYYKNYVQPIPLFPYTNIEELREFISYMPDGNRTLQNLNLSEFVDNSFLSRIEKEGSVTPR
jgi:NitT/TauT family transport system substrate-binding protein